MAKRHASEPVEKISSTPSKRPRRSTQKALANVEEDRTPTKTKSTSARKRGHGTNDVLSQEQQHTERSASPTPKAAVSTPKSRRPQTPSKRKLADQSAKRKSARRLAEVEEDDDDSEGENELAEKILDQDDDVNGILEEGTTPSATPSKRGRGRPKGSKNKRSPTPEGDIAPEERYFFQNRKGPPQISTNAFSSVKPLPYDEYFQLMRHIKDPHTSQKAYLMKIHARAFPQWKFELEQGYTCCLYGFGSKRLLVNEFLTWLYAKSSPNPHIVVGNGYIPRLNIRGVLNTIASVLVAEDEQLRLVGQPHEMLDTLLARLEQHPPAGQVIVVINSIDSSTLRKPAHQSLLSRLAAHRKVQMLVTADSTTFPLMWNSKLLGHFNFAYHDCTTFVPYESEISVVDDVNDLLGRKGRRLGGKEGIGYVLKSLPPNAQNLYRILLAEILSIVNSDMQEELESDDDGPRARRRPEAVEEVGVEYRLLYQKASEEFICSSDMNFRFLLKEFHDHQMISSRRDATGTELLCVPLGKEEMQSVLEDMMN